MNPDHYDILSTFLAEKVKFQLVGASPFSHTVAFGQRAILTFGSNAEKRTPVASFVR